MDVRTGARIVFVRRRNREGGTSSNLTDRTVAVRVEELAGHRFVHASDVPTLDRWAKK